MLFGALRCVAVVLLFRFVFSIRRFYWEWLPAFAGVHGRINELSGGEDLFPDSVFIGGEFNPPVLVWTNDPDVGPSATSERLVCLYFVFALPLLCLCFAFALPRLCSWFDTPFPALPFPSPPFSHLTLPTFDVFQAIGEEVELLGSVTSITQMLLPPPGKRSGGVSESGGAAAGVVHAGEGADSALIPDQDLNVRGENK